MIDESRPPLLETKLFVPPPRANRVSRPRLSDILTARPGGLVTLLSATAGAGKSTLLADWALAQESPVAWISLDEDDDDAGRLLAGIAAALSRAGAISEAVLAETARAITPAAREAALTLVLNAVARAGHRVALVLDDYHAIAAADAHALVQLIADRMPPNLHLLISSRVDPPLALSRLRARDQLIELRAADLRFTRDEAAEFLNGAMRLHLSDEQISELERRTEGWVVGLQMAAISMRSRGTADEFVRTFSGSNRYVLDYLTDEVLAGADPEIRGFLLETSILERLSAPLCDAVTGRTDSESILRRLDAENMFLIPLDDVRFWYRYHHLFGNVLQHQLERSRGTAGAGELHRRASSWYEANGMPGEAIHHSLLGNDVDRAVAIVAANAVPRTLAGEPARVVRWIDQLPRVRVENDLDLLLAQSVALTADYRIARAVEVVTRAETLVGPDTPSADLGRFLAARGTAARSPADAGRARSDLERAIELLPEGTFWSSLAKLNLGIVLTTDDELAKAERVLTAGARQHERSELLLMAILSVHYATQCRIPMGHMAEAAKLAEESLEWIAREKERSGLRLPFASFSYSALAEVYAEWNDLERARDFAARALDLGGHGFSVAFFEASRAMAVVAEVAQEWELAIASLSDALRTMSHAPWWGALAGFRQRIILRRGIATQNASDIASVGAWVKSEGLDRFAGRWPRGVERGVYSDYPYLTTARWLIETGDAAEASSLLDLLENRAFATGRILSAIDVLILRALARRRLGDDVGAVEAMRKALDAAAAPQFIGVFAREREAVLPIVQRAAPLATDSAFAGRVLAALEPRRSAAPLPGSPESLSEREVEVLQLLATGATNQAIGQKLFIAGGTVKKHLENIYGKLGVRGRGEAVARARSIGILQ